LLEKTTSDKTSISDEQVLTVLRAWGFGRNFGRLNVMLDGQSWVHSDNMGLVYGRDGEIRAPLSRSFPNVSQLFVEWLRGLILLLVLVLLVLVVVLVVLLVLVACTDLYVFVCVFQWSQLRCFSLGDT
jgi:hypothetical protein